MTQNHAVLVRESLWFARLREQFPEMGTHDCIELAIKAAANDQTPLSAYGDHELINAARLMREATLELFAGIMRELRE